MKKEALECDPHFNSEPYRYDDVGDEDVTLWHDSGRAARLTDDKDEGGCHVSLFFGSDPWAGPVAGGIVRSITDLKAIVKGWCEANATPSTSEDGRSLTPAEKPPIGSQPDLLTPHTCP